MWNPYFAVGDAILSMDFDSRERGAARLRQVYREAVTLADSAVIARVVEVAVLQHVSLPVFARPGGVVLTRRVSLVK